MQFSKIPIFYYWYSSANSVEFFKRSGRRRAVFCSAMRFWGARRGTPRRYEDRLRHPHRRRGPLNATRRFLIVPRRDKGHPRQHGHAGHHHGEGRHPIGCAHMGGKWAGESSRKPRRPRPYSRAFAGRALRSASRPKAASMRVPCHHACPMNPWFLQRCGTPRRYGLRIIASA